MPAIEDHELLETFRRHRDLCASLLDCSRQQMALIVDENYLRESMLLPQAKVVEGFDPVMPIIGALKDQDIDDLIAYIKTLE